jgi:hypothetical protein
LHSRMNCEIDVSSRRRERVLRNARVDCEIVK